MLLISLLVLAVGMLILYYAFYVRDPSCVCDSIDFGVIPYIMVGLPTACVGAMLLMTRLAFGPIK